MKGQMVFEFIIAGLFFFAIIIYSMNYLNMNANNFKSDFYKSLIQAKSVQISEILMNEKSSMGLVDGIYFNMSKIQNFNATYCDPLSVEAYSDMVREFHLFEKTTYGVFPHDINIFMADSNGGIVFECGVRVPRNVQKAEMTRVGILNDGTARLAVIVW